MVPGDTDETLGDELLGPCSHFPFKCRSSRTLGSGRDGPYSEGDCLHTSAGYHVYPQISCFPPPFSTVLCREGRGQKVCPWTVTQNNPKMPGENENKCKPKTGILKYLTTIVEKANSNKKRKVKEGDCQNRDKTDGPTA